MARVIEGTTIEALRDAKPTRWGQYLDGRLWELQRGVDFTTELATARAGLYMACMREHGAAFIVRSFTAEDAERGGEKLVIQMCKRDKPEAP